MLAACLVLIAASLTKFVIYQRQNSDRKTAAGEVWGYGGLAANGISLIVIACAATAAVVSMPPAAKRPTAQQPPLAANPSPADSSVADKENQERIRQMQADPAARREEERKAALKPQWRPYQPQEKATPSEVTAWAPTPGRAEPDGAPAAAGKPDPEPVAAGGQRGPRARTCPGKTCNCLGGNFAGNRSIRTLNPRITAAKTCIRAPAVTKKAPRQGRGGFFPSSGKPTTELAKISGQHAISFAAAKPRGRSKPRPRPAA